MTLSLNERARELADRLAADAERAARRGDRRCPAARG